MGKKNERISNKQRTFSFTSEERKVFAKGHLDLAIRIHDFLKDFIDKHDEDFIRDFCWQHEKFNSYLNAITFLKAEHSTRIEKICELSRLIARHSKQKKNIPLDCLLLGVGYFPEPQQIKRVKQDLEEFPSKSLVPELREDVLRNIIKRLYARCDLKKLSEVTGIENKDTLAKRIYRAKNTKYIQEIFDLAFSLITF